MPDLVRLPPTETISDDYVAGRGLARTTTTVFLQRRRRWRRRFSNANVSPTPDDDDDDVKLSPTLSLLRLLRDALSSYALSAAKLLADTAGLSDPIKSTDFDIPQIESNT